MNAQDQPDLVFRKSTDAHNSFIRNAHESRDLDFSKLIESVYSHQPAACDDPDANTALLSPPPTHALAYPTPIHLHAISTNTTSYQSLSVLVKPLAIPSRSTTSYGKRFTPQATVAVTTSFSYWVRLAPERRRS